MSDTGTHALRPALSRVPLKDEDLMYPLESTASGVVRHSRFCQATFARRDWSCHRCVELLLGAAPRNGWQHEYFARKLRRHQRSFDFPASVELPPENSSNPSTSHRPRQE